MIYDRIYCMTWNAQDDIRCIEPWANAGSPLKDDLAYKSQQTAGSNASLRATKYWFHVLSDFCNIHLYTYIANSFQLDINNCNCLLPFKPVWVGKPICGNLWRAGQPMGPRYETVGCNSYCKCSLDCFRKYIQDRYVNPYMFWIKTIQNQVKQNMQTYSWTWLNKCL